MKYLNKFLTKTDEFISRISAITIFIMMMWIVIDVVLRSVFHTPVSGTIEITGEYLLVIIVYLSISYTYKEGGHVSVELFENKFSVNIKKIIKLFTNLLTIIVFVLLGIANFQKGLNYFVNDIRTTSLLNYPLAPALFIITFGVLLLVINLILESINILRGKKGF
ncbi:TRAP transporter small permease [Psychrobacillus sp. NPDC096426]|uniref:TRAP transporter small permease n=1 Tax=Psychrobacillus sp. NPDC096426 TaxID=3364491 RepID=UPI0038241BFE